MSLQTVAGAEHVIFVGLYRSATGQMAFVVIDSHRVVL